MAYRLLEVVSLGGLDERKLQDILSKPPVPGERDLKQARIKFVISLIKANEYNRCDWASCLCKEDSIDYRVNGQHTSHVLERVSKGEIPDAEFPSGVPVTFTRYECDTKDDLADVFDQFDQHHSSRSADDKLGIYIARHEDLMGIDKKLIGKILAGVFQLRSQKHEMALEQTGHILVPEAHERGRLLAIDEIRDFIDVMHDYEGSPFRLWTKPGIVARLYLLYIEEGEEKSRLLVEQMVNMVDEGSKLFAEAVQRADSKTGHDAGWYYRKADKHLKSLLKMYAQVGPEAIKKLIRDVMEEDTAEAVAS